MTSKYIVLSNGIAFDECTKNYKYYGKFIMFGL
jgi:hypothetical protein